MGRSFCRLSVVAILLMALGCSPNPYPGEEGKILHVSERLIPKGFDPAECEDEGTGQLQAQVYEGLYIYHPFARPFRLMPAIAETMPQMSEDNLTVTIPLKKGIRFIDDPCFTDGKGREVVASDFVFSFLRICHPDVISPGIWTFDGVIVGVDEWRDKYKGRGELSGFDDPPVGFRALDSHTLQIKLVRPYPQLEWVLAMGYTVAYPREAVEHYGDKLRRHPVGSGPFRLTEFREGFKFKYIRNEHYRELRVPGPTADGFVGKPWPNWEKDQEAGLLVNAGKKAPMLDGMEFLIMLEQQPRFLYFKSGYLDFLNPPKDNVGEVLVDGVLSEEMETRKIQLQKVPEQGTVYTTFNCVDETLSNVDLRRAISCAMDTSRMIRVLYSKLAQHAPSLVPPGNAGHTGDYMPYQSPGGEPNIEKAKSLLAKAGYPDGFVIDPTTGKPRIDPNTGDPQRLTLSFQMTGSSTTSHEFSDAFVRDMRKIGIEVKKIPGTFPQALKNMKERNYQICSMAWGLDYPDAQNILNLLYGPNAAPGPNRANFDDPKFNELYDRAKVMQDSPERTELYEQMSRIVSDQVPWVTRTHRLSAALNHSWLQGFRYTKVNYQYWRFMGVDAEARRKATQEWNKPYWVPVIVFVGALCVLAFITVTQRRKRA